MQFELKHREPRILPGDPYKECCTGRKGVGNTLTQIVDSIELGGTIALDGVWGTGKTTFLHMWLQELKDNRYPTVFLNAWETEWAEDPLIAVISCIYQACQKTPNQTIQVQINSLLNSFVKHPLPLVGTIVKNVIESKIGTEVTDVVDEVKDLSADSFDKEVKSFDKRQNSIVELKKLLERLAWDVNQGVENEKPLVFIIDELDRCRPDYAVRMLEVLKHFFEVKNIVFVCAVDKEHLENSIRGYYGSEKLNAAEYLRRFFDLEIELPKPDYKQFCEYLYIYFKLDEFFESDERLRISFFKNDGDGFKTFLSSFAERSKMTLRQIERLCALTRISLIGKNKRIYYYPQLGILFSYMRFFEYDLYQEIKRHKLSVQELLNLLVSKFSDMIDQRLSAYDSGSNHHMMLVAIVELLYAYNNDSSREELIYDGETKTTPLVCAKFASEEIVEILSYLTHSPMEYHLSLLYNVLDILKVDDR